MKYIKTFEFVNDQNPKYKVGDIVYATNGKDYKDDNTINLQNGIPYEIEEVSNKYCNYESNIICYKLKGIYHYFLEPTLISEIEKMAKKYNIG